MWRNPPLQPTLQKASTMELNTELITTPPRDAASVMLLRDAAQGLEVFLLERAGQSDVMGGAHVFPGGKVDAQDAEIDAERLLDADARQLHASLREPEIAPATALALYVAAVREVFEECGVLMAQGVSPSQVRDAATLLREGHAFDEVLAMLSLRLDTACMLPWSRWITPKLPSMMRKRFDTRFFVARMPAEQTATHDMRETSASLWIAPGEALQRNYAGQLPLAPPQIMSIAHLSRFASVEAVLGAARQQAPALIEPHSFDEDGVRHHCYPGDPAHPVGQRAMPGPTRLRVVNGRFEPVEGFDAFFA